MQHNLQVLNGEREGSRIYHCGDGHYYHYNNEYTYGRNEGDGGEVYLRCRQYDTRGCPGKVTITINPGETHWQNTHHHTCAANRDEAQVLVLKRAIIEESAQMLNGQYEEPAELVERIRNRFPPNIAARVTVAGMRTAIQRARAVQYPAVPVTLYGLGALLTDRQDVLTTINGADNLLGGVVNGPGGTTSIIFLSRRMRRLMSRSRVIFCDGTFGTRPNHPDSSQVLQIITMIGNAAVPIGVVLMTGKTEAEYTAVLHHLRQLVPRFNPVTVMTDFEIALQNAWRTVFPNANTVTCYWHNCRAILRKAEELGLIPHMRNNRHLKNLIRSFCAIPLLPQNLIERGVATLMREALRRGFLPLLNDFMEYYINTYMTMPFFGSLSVFQQAQRTNNVAESCNRLLRKKTGAHRPGLWHFYFIGAVKRYEYQSFLAFRTAEMGQDINRGRRVSSITNDANINNFTTQLFQGFISIRTFLHRSSYRVLNVFDRFVVD